MLAILYKCGVVYSQSLQYFTNMYPDSKLRIIVPYKGEGRKGKEAKENEREVNDYA